MRSACCFARIRCVLAALALTASEPQRTRSLALGVAGGRRFLIRVRVRVTAYAMPMCIAFALTRDILRLMKTASLLLATVTTVPHSDIHKVSAKHISKQAHQRELRQEKLITLFAFRFRSPV